MAVTVAVAVIRGKLVLVSEGITEVLVRVVVAAIWVLVDVGATVVLVATVVGVTVEDD